MTGNDQDDPLDLPPPRQADLRWRFPRIRLREDDDESSQYAQRTLAIAIVGSALMIGTTVLFWPQDRSVGIPSNPAAVALPESWEPSPGNTPIGVVSEPAIVESPESRSDQGASVAPTKPSSTRTPPPPRPAAPTTPPRTKPPAPARPNLSLAANADADGSSKAAGTRFGNVRDGNGRSFWSPTGSTGPASAKWGRASARWGQASTRWGQASTKWDAVSVKWTAPVTLTRITIREAAGGGRISYWRVRNHDTGAVLATGTRTGVITFSRTKLRKITFEIRGAAGVPRIAEFETFAR